MTISITREIITRNRSVYDCMKMDLINYTALAVKIQPEIEKILGNRVNLNTVVVAIKRYADSFEIKEEIKEESVLKNARLSLLPERLLPNTDSVKLSSLNLLIYKYKKYFAIYQIIYTKTLVFLYLPKLYHVYHKNYHKLFLNLFVFLC